MKKKEQKRFESTAFILLEVLAKAVEMKKLQLDEKKLNIDREMWLEKRSGQKVGSEVSKQSFPSGGITGNAENWTGKIVGTGLLSDGKEFVIPKRYLPIQGGQKYYSAGCPEPEKIRKNHLDIIQELETGSFIPLKNTYLDALLKDLKFDDMNKYGVQFHEVYLSDAGSLEVKPVDINNVYHHFDALEYFVLGLGKSKKEIHEEALKNGLKTEKKTFLNGCHFRVKPEEALYFLRDSRKELFFFIDRQRNEIQILKTEEEVKSARYFPTEIYFRWVQR